MFTCKSSVGSDLQENLLVAPAFRASDRRELSSFIPDFDMDLLSFAASLSEPAAEPSSSTGEDPPVGCRQTITSPLVHVLWVLLSSQVYKRWRLLVLVFTAGTGS